MLIKHILNPCFDISASAVWSHSAFVFGTGMSLRNIIELVFVMKTQCVLCEAGTNFKVQDPPKWR
jgi:hypothetical protein